MAFSEEIKQKLITIAENIQKVYNKGVNDGWSASSSNPAEAIYFANDVRIEARKDGLWLIEGEDETHLYDNKGGYIYSTHSGEADFANESVYASYDDYGRELKGTTLYEFDDSYAYAYLEDGANISYGIVDYYSVNMPDDYSIGFESNVYFTTPSYVGDDFVETDDVYYKGDHTSDGTFTPEADTRYTIKYEYNGERFVGTVSGVPIL